MNLKQEWNKAEVDALQCRQTESKRGLHSPLHALLLTTSTVHTLISASNGESVGKVSKLSWSIFNSQSSSYRYKLDS